MSANYTIAVWMSSIFLHALLSLLSTGKVRQPRTKSERATSGGRATGVQPREIDSQDKTCQYQSHKIQLVCIYLWRVLYVIPSQTWYVMVKPDIIRPGYTEGLKSTQEKDGVFLNPAFSEKPSYKKIPFHLLSCSQLQGQQVRQE